jgi:hypothetical protein
VLQGQLKPNREVTVDNLRVPQNATCRLDRTRIKGTIKVERNATLRARRVRVIGNVQAENARRVVVIRSSRVGGSVQIGQGGAARVAARESPGTSSTTPTRDP